jgi:hypothetical protein
LAHNARCAPNQGPVSGKTATAKLPSVTGMLRLAPVAEETAA